MRYTGPKTRINRRFGQVIFPANKSFERRPHLPGQHGPRLRRRATGYSVGLNEKQKLRYLFGLTERQFRIVFERAKRLPGVTGEAFLRLLEMRLDSVVYLMGIAKTRRAARQFVTHGHVAVNGHKVDIASYTCRAGDEIEVRGKSSSKQLATASVDVTQYRTIPAWLAVQSGDLKGTVTRLPTPEEMTQGINVQTIVEFYSR